MKPSELPLEQLALPAHVRHLLDSITEQAPEPAEPEEVAVVRQTNSGKASSGPSLEKPNKQSYRARLSPEILAKADRIIEAGLKCDAESGKERSGWKKDLAAFINRHPSWVTNRIKTHHANQQAVAA